MSGNLFISYSHEDEEWKNRVVKHLQVLARQGHLETWDDRRIGGGEDWYEAIVQAIEAGSVAVLLISANSLTSEFILKEEVPRLLALRDSGRLRRLIPLVIKPCPWQAVDWLKRMNMRPRDGKALSTMSDAAIDEALSAFALEVFQLMTAPDPQPWEKTVSRGCNALIDFLKCDRDAQQHAFNSRFTTWFQGQRGLPQFHIIHGRKEDRPGSLVKRLGRIELDMAVAWLKKHKHLETGATPLFKEVAWPVMTAVDQLVLAPQYAELINNLFEKFSDHEQCSYYPDEETWPAIFAGFCNDPVIAISHEIITWDEPTQALAERYQKFWRDVRDEVRKRPVPPQFLILMHVQYPSEPKPGWLGKLMARKTDYSERVNQALNELNQKLAASGFQAQVMGKLTEITAEDVYKWAKECQYTERDGKFRNRIEKFYGTRTHIPMSEVEEWLEERCRELSEQESGLHKGA
jgi:hypothetical protein